MNKTIASALLLALIVSCDGGINKIEESIEVLQIDGIDAISSVLTYRASGDPSVSIVVVDTSSILTVHHPGNIIKANGFTTGSIEFSPVGPAARSITLIAVWTTKTTEIEIKRSHN